MRTFAFFLAASILLLAQPPARGKPPTKQQLDKIRSLYQASRAAYQAKDHAKALENLQAVLKILPAPEGTSIDPNAARVHYDIACNYALLGKKEEAIANLESAVAKGFWDYQFLQSDGTLKDLRADKRFTALVQKSRRGIGAIAFGLKDIHGKVIRKKDFEGKVLVIDIWGTWCPPCRKEIPHFIKLYKKYGKKGVAVIGLTWERRPPDESIRKRVTEFASTNGINYRVALIPYGLLQSIPNMRGFPTTLYIDRSGELAGRVTGAEPYGRIESRILPLLKKKS